jgi:hypothetical protein
MATNAYFTGDCLFWDDPDFQTVQQKATYAMLWQSITTDIAGVHARNDQIDAYRVGIGYIEYQNTLSWLENAEKIKILATKIWVKSAIWRNLNKGKYSKSQMSAVIERMRATSDGNLISEIIDYYKEKYSLCIPYPYPIPTPSLYSITESVTVTDTTGKAVSEEPTLPKKPKEFLEGFKNLKIEVGFYEQLQKTYPKEILDIELKKADLWVSANPTRAKKNYHRFMTNWLANISPELIKTKTEKPDEKPYLMVINGIKCYTQEDCDKEMMG